MSKRRNYREIRKETAERMGDETPDEPTDELLPCRYCGVATKRATLSVLGARCQTCFAQYLSFGFSGSEAPPRPNPDPRFASLRARSRAYAAGRTDGFVALGQELKRRVDAQRVPHDLADDDVNALLQAAGGER